MDDSDLLQVLSALQSAGLAIVSLQKAVDTWEAGLKVTGGALAPEKTFWYLIDFEWVGGDWRYKAIKDIPGKLYANDINKNRIELRRVEPHIAEETLGIHLAPSGNLTQQASKMQQMATEWAASLKQGKLSKSKVWLALISPLWRSLSYPLPALNLTKEQCEQIMAPALDYALPAMGICRNFPRVLVFAPEKYFGLGMPHLYTLQEIFTLSDLILHTERGTMTGLLVQAKLELLLIELSSNVDLHLLPFHRLQGLSSNSLIKSTWAFLHSHGIRLCHYITMPAPRENDIELMTFFYQHAIQSVMLDQLNKCRLFLKAFIYLILQKALAPIFLTKPGEVNRLICTELNPGLIKVNLRQGCGTRGKSTSRSTSYSVDVD